MTNGGGHHDQKGKKKASPKKGRPVSPKKTLLTGAVQKKKK